MPLTSQLLRHSALFIILALSSLGLGSMVNLLRDQPLGIYYQTPAQRLTGETIKQQPEKDQKIRKKINIITLEDLAELMANDRALIFDVRPKIFYQLGHIPGSHNFQIKKFQTDYKTQKQRIKLAISEDKEIILYCAGPHCPDASKVASKLLDLGHGNLSVFEEGWEIWTLAGLEQESNQ